MHRTGVPGGMLSFNHTDDNTSFGGMSIMIPHTRTSIDIMLLLLPLGPGQVPESVIELTPS